MSSLAPGAYFQEVDQPAYTAVGDTSTTPVFIGAHQQGPLSPQLVESWPQFRQMYGGFGPGAPSQLSLAVYLFFNNGGGSCYVIRVVHDDATAATLTLDGALEAAPAAAPTVTVEGTAGTGAYSYEITLVDAGGETTASPAGSTTTGAATLDATDYLQVGFPAPPEGYSYNVYRTAVPTGSTLTTGLIGTDVTGTTFNDTGLPASATQPPTTNDTASAQTLTVTGANPGAWTNQLYISILDNADGSFTLEVYNGGTTPPYRVEVWDSLTMGQFDPRYALAVVNNPTTGSNYVRLTDLLGTASEGGPIPAATATPVQFGTQGGSQGSNGSAVVATDITATTTLLDTILGVLVINVPGNSDAADTLNPLIAYCQTQRAEQNAMLVIDPPSGQNRAGLLTFKQSLTPSSYAVLYGPWVVIPDPASTAPGALRTVAPCGAVLGIWAQNDATRGVQSAPAGEWATISAINLESPPNEGPLSSSDIGALNAAGVNCIRYLPGTGLCVWGARTLSANQQVLFINVRRALIEIEQNAVELTQFATFDNNDYTTWTTIALALENYLNGLFSEGFFAGSSAASSYYVVCDDTINTYQSDTINAQVGVALAEPSEFIMIQISQWNGTTTTTTTASNGSSIN